MFNQVLTIHESGLIGLTKDSAIKIIKDNNLVARVVCEDGEHFMLTCDYKFNRINLTIQDGKVVSVSRG